jgi:hypothetical protein
MRRMYIGEDVSDEYTDEGLGAVDIMGAEDDDDLNALLSGIDIVGRAKRRRRRGSVHTNKLARQVALARAAGGVVVRQRPERDKREQYMPIGPSVATGPGVGWALTLIPVRPCRLGRLFFDATLGQTFDLNTYNIGGETQLLGGGTIPFSMFAENAVRTAGQGKSVVAGVPILLGGTNISPVGTPAAIVRGGLMCVALV